MMTVPNVLADRYASSAMREIWSPVSRIRTERELWLAVLKAQADLGLPIPEGAVAAYEANLDRIDLDEIRRREAESRHDVKAKIEAYNAVAGFEEIHKGMTSRDLTENVEQLLAWKSLGVVLEHAIAGLKRMVAKARTYSEIVITARTHNVPAQPTTLGKRIAMFAEELEMAIAAARQFRDGFAVRGIKGAVGTQLDQMTLFRGDPDKVAALERRVLGHLGIECAFQAVGQVYPRSQDAALVGHLLGLGAGPSNFARTLRLMAGHETAGEGFAKGQVGSSAMPHKMNSRSCERVNGFMVLLRGYQTMAAGLAGDQWHEGDVSCSVVRRVVIPDSFFAIDGLFETFLSILDQFVVHEALIEAENQRYLPFLATTTLLMRAVQSGVGRETAHEVIKEHAVAVARDLRDGRIASNNLVDRLAEDGRLGLGRAEIAAVVSEAVLLVGRAREQIKAVASRLEGHLQAFPGADGYCPGGVL